MWRFVTDEPYALDFDIGVGIWHWQDCDTDVHLILDTDQVTSDLPDHCHHKWLDLLDIDISADIWH